MFALSVAGFDPSGGAGVLMDVKVWALMDIKGAGVISALTVQSGRRFTGWSSVSESYFKEALRVTLFDLPIKGIKVGMLGSERLVCILAEMLSEVRDRVSWVVFDPVLRATLGKSLYSGASYLTALREKLLPLVDYITPNFQELSALFGVEEEEGPLLEKALSSAISRYRLKGIILTGLSSGEEKGDLFFEKGGKKKFLTTKSLPREFHGTGCAFSSAFLGFLLKGFSPEEAFEKAKNWLYLYLEKAVKTHLEGELCLFL